MLTLRHIFDKSKTKTDPIDLTAFVDRLKSGFGNIVPYGGKMQRIVSTVKQKNRTVPKEGHTCRARGSCDNRSTNEFHTMGSRQISHSDATDESVAELPRYHGKTDASMLDER